MLVTGLAPHRFAKGATRSLQCSTIALETITRVAQVWHRDNGSYRFGLLFVLASDGPIQRVRSPTNACGHFPCSRSWRYVCASEQRDFKRGNCFAYWNDNQVRVSVSLFAKKTTRKCADHTERPYDFERCQVRFRRSACDRGAKTVLPKDRLEYVARPTRRTDHHPVCVRKITN